MAEQLVIDALQRALVDLTDLSLQAKQYHWNIQGDRFRALHLALDEIVDQVREDLDEVAERVSTLGGTPDGRAATVARDSGIGDVAEGTISVADAYKQMESKLMAASERIKSDLEKVDDADSLSGDILVGAARGLEKQAWFLRAAIEK
ncbi:MAG: DNA starvation/stationary phase protection protein [Actinomyces sp.]|nr:DNA starvation/stationary phase protection protein [Actinomyces sp.]